MMRLNSNAPARRAIVLTPLIDVVFLLLIFFMLSSTFLRFGQVAIETGSSAAGVADASTVVLLSIAGDGRVMLNGEAVALDTLPEVFDANLKAGRTQLAVMAQASATTADLIAVLSLARQSSFAGVHVLEGR